METFTWYDNMRNYYRDLACVALNMGLRIDKDCENVQLLHMVLDLIDIQNKYNIHHDK